jgi:hypothetical protein
MPTGYIEKILKDKNVTFEEFAMDCARSFGVFVALGYHTLENEKEVECVNSRNEWIKQLRDSLKPKSAR